MTHPIVALQAALVAALRADPGFAAAVFDAPPQDAEPPYVSIARHDVLPRDGDATPGHEHRLLLHAWAADASRKAALGIAQALLAIALDPALAVDRLALTLRRHDRTETTVDARTGRARAAIALTYFTEPND